VSLQAILARIQAAGETQIEEIRLHSECETQAILAEAQAQAEQIYQAACRQALSQEAGEQARIRNQAHFEALCLVGKAHEQLVEAALAQVTQQLQEIRRCTVYPAALERILYEMLPGLDGLHKLEDRLILEADPCDRSILENMLHEKGIQIQVDYCLTCWGGLNARSPDGNTHLLNTFESRLARGLPYIRQYLLQWFEQEAEEAAQAQYQGSRHVRL
jgi:vacuolar-type H+-ATPase subunit E/Vma4